MSNYSAYGELLCFLVVSMTFSSLSHPCTAGMGRMPDVRMAIFIGYNVAFAVKVQIFRKAVNALN